MLIEYPSGNYFIADMFNAALQLATTVILDCCTRLTRLLRAMRPYCDPMARNLTYFNYSFILI